MLNFSTDSFTMGLMKESKTLIKVRISFYTLCYIHLVAVASLLYSIDFDSFEDPDIQLYKKIRFKLITAWFNLFTGVYYPISIYCDWRELKGEHEQNHVKFLNHIRNLCFTSIIMPVTAFADILFWRVWNTQKELIAPLSIHTVVPYWTQHCMHTVSLIIALIDLMLVRRERPKSYALSIGILTSFLVVYTVVCLQSCLRGEYVYPALKIFSGYKLPVLIIYVFIENYFYYTSQWILVDMVWGQSNGKKIVSI